VGAISNALKHPFSEGVYLPRTLVFHDPLRRQDEAGRNAKAMAALCEERGCAEMGAFASASVVVWLIRQGGASKGIELLRVYVEVFRSLNAYSGLSDAAPPSSRGARREWRSRRRVQTSGRDAGHDHADWRALEAEALRLRGEMFASCLVSTIRRAGCTAPSLLRVIRRRSRMSCAQRPG
jgi:hypothetical protein